MIRFAIVGCGHIANKHVQAIEACGGGVLHAVCDTNRISAERLASHTGAKPYADLDALLLDPEVDVVSICTPSGVHAAQAIRAARAGKHVIVEKPIALTLEDADAIVGASRESGVKLAVVHPNRFRPAVAKLKSLLDHGKLGKLSHVDFTVRWNRDQSYYDQAAWRGTRQHDGGVLMNQAIHNLDLLLWLIGDVAHVQALTATRLRNIETEDVALALVRFANGAVGIIEAASTIYPCSLEESIAIFGEDGTVIVSGPTANWITHWNVRSVDEAATEELIRSINEDPFGVPGHHCIIDDMVAAIREDREPAVNGEEGRKALALVLAVYEAAERAKPALTQV